MKRKGTKIQEISKLNILDKTFRNIYDVTMMAEDENEPKVIRFPT